MDADTEKGNTPIADAFAYGRAVDPAAMVLIRRLERDRAELIEVLRLIGYPKIIFRYPLDKL